MDGHLSMLQSALSQRINDVLGLKDRVSQYERQVK